MRIIISLMYYRPHYSGLTIYTERLARALANRGHHVNVLTSRFDPHLPDREVRDGVRIIRPRVMFKVSKGVIMPSLPLWAWKLIRQSDVINAHVPQPDAAVLTMLSRMIRKPSVLTYHCDLHLLSSCIHRPANLALHLSNHFSARAANTIVSDTRDCAEHSAFLRHNLDKDMSSRRWSS